MKPSKLRLSRIIDRRESRMPTLRLHCFGTFRAELDGEPIANFDTDKTRALLAYLAVEAGRAQHRERLAGLLWSDQPEKHALHSLRQALSHLRKLLRQDDPGSKSAPFLLVGRDTIEFNPASDYWLDVQAFRQGLAEAYRHVQRLNGRGGLNLRALQRALLHYQGPLLDQLYLNGSPLFDEWAALLREETSRQAIEACARLADYHERRGEYALARQFASRMVALAPWEETAQVQLLRLLALDGQWSAALNQYAQLRRYLSEQLGVEPMPASRALFEQVRAAAANHTPLPARFPPPRQNLPETPTPFVGRACELDELAEAIANPECRLLTLLGPGGVGKTRLALQAAHQQLGLWPDGVFFVPLAAVNSGEQAVLAMGEAAGLAFSERGRLADQLLDFLRRKTLLLVLDNFEQLLGCAEQAAVGCTGLLTDLFHQAPGVMLLVTSRERLNLQEECVYPLEGLAYPVGAAPIDDPQAYDALALFASRARQAQGRFELTSELQPAVIRICQLLEGLALGVELAAAASGRQSCAEIAARLAQDLDTLTATATNVPSRHRSLRAAFDVSWQLLNAAEQATLAQLSVFRGGFSGAAAVAVTGAVPEMLATLVDKSLLRRSPAGRHEMHEAIRQYAADRLAETPGAAAAAQARHAAYYAAFLAAHQSDLKGLAQAAALEAIHQEYDNANTAWISLAVTQDAAGLAQAAESLYQYCSIRSRFSAGIELFEQASQALAETGQHLVLGMLLARLGALAYRARQHELAGQALEESREIFSRLEQPGELAHCLITLGGLQLRKKNFNAALAHAQQGLELFRRQADTWGEAYALHLLGLIHNRQGDFAGSQPFLVEAVRLGRQIGDERRLIAPLNLLGDSACSAGDYASAGEYFYESLAISRRLGDRWNEAILLNNLATVYQALGQYDLEQAAFEESLAICREIGDRDGEAIALNGLGEMAVYLGKYREAVAYSQAALRIGREIEEDWTIQVCLSNLGQACCGLGDHPAARAHLREALALAHATDSWNQVGRTAIHLARLDQLQGRPHQAVQLLQAALAHPATEAEARAEAERWLSELGVCELVKRDESRLEEAVQALLASGP
jgi:predicted ATPase